MRVSGIRAILAGLLASSAATPALAQLHYAANGNFDRLGAYKPGAVGFNLADVQTVRQLNALPEGVRGLVWLGLCDGVDEKFIATVRPYIGNPKLFGLFIADDIDPTGRYSSLCTPDNIKAEVQWIKQNAPGAVTFVELMNMGSSQAPRYVGSPNPANSGADLFGIAPYPCRAEFNGCDLDEIDRYVAAAETAGIPRARLVPIFQAFGGGEWVNDAGAKFLLPTPDQQRAILERWASLLPTPVFDIVYSWGMQRSAKTLESSPELQAVFAARNRIRKSFHDDGPQRTSKPKQN